MACGGPKVSAIGSTIFTWKEHISSLANALY